MSNLYPKYWYYNKAMNALVYCGDLTAKTLVKGFEYVCPSTASSLQILKGASVFEADYPYFRNTRGEA